MSAANRPVSVHDLRGMKERGERFVMLTAYDAPTGRLLDEAGVPVLLVGDSVANAVLGYDSTVPVSLDEMAHHTRAVRRGVERAIVVADLPFGSYQVAVDDGIRAAVRLVKEAGANAVKAEGAGPVVELARRLVSAGVPFMGHLGLTPQSVNQLGYRVQGRDERTAEAILHGARELEDAGAFAVVLECVPSDLARRVTEAVSIPTIGIGAGPHTDAQVLVFHDLVGLTDGHKPRFVKTYADTRAVIADAVKSFSAEVASGDYPGPEHTYE
jgi:3-methyl-2-oxobutanoate hydroxymethyltransferase